MADISIDSALSDGTTITVTGTGFTATTTNWAIDGEEVTPDSITATKATFADDGDSSSIAGTKAGVTSGPVNIQYDAPIDPFEEATVADPAPAITVEDAKTEQEKAPGTDPVSAPVEPVKATILEIDPREPYPTGGGEAA